MSRATLALSALILAVACAGDGPPCGCAVPVAADPITGDPAPPPQIVAFLVDRSVYYAHVENDLPNMALTLTAQAIASSGPKPGDVFYAAWITPKSPAKGDDFLNVTSVPVVDTPTTRVQPTRPPDKRGQIGCGSYCKDTVGRYQSELETWQQQSTADITAWRSKQDAIARTFVQETTKSLQLVRAQIDNDYPDIRGALYGVSRVFLQHPEVTARKLVIYSGLIERPTGAKTEFNLAGVNILVAQYHRHGADYQREGETTWRGLFQAAGAQLTRPFFPDNATSVTDIANFLRDRKK